MVRVFFFFFICVSLFFSCREAAPSFALFSGVWESKENGMIFKEEWHSCKDSLIGKASEMKADSILFSEDLVIVRRDGDWFYIPTVNDQNEGKPVLFKLVKYSKDEFVFANPAHDFPKKIIYRFNGDDVMSALVKGEEKGEQKEFTIHFSRTHD